MASDYRVPFLNSTGWILFVNMYLPHAALHDFTLRITHSEKLKNSKTEKVGVREGDGDVHRKRLGFSDLASLIIRTGAR